MKHGTDGEASERAEGFCQTVCGDEALVATARYLAKGCKSQGVMRMMGYSQGHQDRSVEVQSHSAPLKGSRRSSRSSRRALAKSSSPCGPPWCTRIPPVSTKLEPLRAGRSANPCALSLISNPVPGRNPYRERRASGATRRPGLP